VLRKPSAGEVAAGPFVRSTTPPDENEEVEGGNNDPPAKGSHDATPSIYRRGSNETGGYMKGRYFARAASPQQSYATEPLRRRSTRQHYSQLAAYRGTAEGFFFFFHRRHVTSPSPGAACRDTFDEFQQTEYDTYREKNTGAPVQRVALERKPCSAFIAANNQRRRRGGASFQTGCARVLPRCTCAVQYAAGTTFMRFRSQPVSCPFHRGRQKASAARHMLSIVDNGYVQNIGRMQEGRRGRPRDIHRPPRLNRVYRRSAAGRKANAQRGAAAVCGGDARSMGPRIRQSCSGIQRKHATRSSTRRPSVTANAYRYRGC